MGNALGKTIRGQEQKLSDMCSTLSMYFFGFIFGMALVYIIIMIIMAVTVTKNPEIAKMGMEAMSKMK